MSAEQTIQALLTSTAGITALTGTRIYSRLVPVDKGLPAIAVRRLETEYVTTIHANAIAAGRAQMEIACMGTTVGEAETLAAEVITALSVAGYAATNRAAEEDIELGTWATLISVGVWE